MGIDSGLVILIVVLFVIVAAAAAPTIWFFITMPSPLFVGAMPVRFLHIPKCAGQYVNSLYRDGAGRQSLFRDELVQISVQLFEPQKVVARGVAVAGHIKILRRKMDQRTIVVDEVLIEWPRFASREV